MSETISPNPQPQATVAVVVPSYNHAKYVGGCVRSIINQTLSPSQLLVIDDGSTDGSPAIIESVLQACPFPCELIVRENRGLCATLNEGLERTGGKYFAYLDSDDLWLADALEARVALLESRPDAVLAYGHVFFVDSENRVIDSTKNWANYADGDVRAMLLETTGPMSPSVLYRRCALEKYGWTGSSHLEDYELYLRLSTDGPFAFDNEPRAAWRRHSANVSHDQRLMLDEHLKAQQRVLPTHFQMSEDAIRKLQSEIKFRRAEDFLRLGAKREALQLIAGNIRGATSARNIVRMAARLMIPYGLVKRRQTQRQEKTFAEHGTIDIA
jgi:alpha-1,3-rhamnosyltransferase